MRRKLLVLAGLLGLCFIGSADRSALAVPFCSGTYCNSNPNAQCQCPQGTLAFPTGLVIDCYTWRADCNYL